MAVRIPIGTEMTVAASVISSVPIRAWKMPPCSSPTTLYIDMERNWPLIAGSPFFSTTQSSHTRGATASANALQTRAVTKRSTAARLPSTSRDHPGIATR